MLDQLKTELSAKPAPGTVRKMFEVMRGAINFAIKRKLWHPVSNLGGFTMPRVDNKGERFFNGKPPDIRPGDWSEYSEGKRSNKAG